MPQEAAAPLLSMQGISKSFPGVRALDNVSLELREGEVLALVGENGAGKSTLMKILSGALTPEEGEIRIDGVSLQLDSVKAAREQGIALIHQELMLAPNLTVAANIFLGCELRQGGPLRLLDRTTMNAAAHRLLQRVGLDTPPKTPLRTLSTGQMQMVEIAKALALNARIVLMDEPTSSLTTSEAARLFEIIADLRKSDIAVIYISHRMEEVLKISDRILVLRDGQLAGELDAKATHHDEIVTHMVGREFSTWFPKRSNTPGETVLEVDHLVVPGTREAVSFQARRGEILGGAGLVGSRRTELMQVLFGVDAPLSGAVALEGTPYRPATPAEAISRGVYLVPEDRKLHGLVLGMRITENISLPDIANYEPRWRLHRGLEQRKAEAQVKKLAIKTPTVRQRVVNLSGGNQQKVVLGKWLAMQPKVLILDEPTRGIDVGAKAEIYRHMAELAARGITLLVVSSEMEEVIGMSDRVLVLHERKLQAILERDELSEEAILGHMTGKEQAA